MKPIHFPEANVTFGENQPDCIPLPACHSKNGDGLVVTCWQLSEEEINRVAETGVIWMSQTTLNRPLPPMFLSVEKGDVLIVVEHETVPQP